MPLIIVVSKEPLDNKKIFLTLRTIAAKALSFSGRTLELKDFSIIPWVVPKAELIGNVEITILSDQELERVETRDERARKVKDYLMKQHPEVGEVRVSIFFPFMGYSF